MSFSSFVKFTGPEARGPGKGVPSSEWVHSQTKQQLPHQQKDNRWWIVECGGPAAVSCGVSAILYVDVKYGPLPLNRSAKAGGAGGALEADSWQVDDPKGSHLDLLRWRRCWNSSGMH
eukprot:scaffold37677_cov59-Cyclotella_meneghiniana.AAC.1